MDPVSTLDLSEPVVIEAETSLASALSLMAEKNVGCLLVLNKTGELTGILAEGDFFNKVAGENVDLATSKVQDFMTANPTPMKETDSIGYAMHLMALHGYRHIPVVNEDGKPIKVVSFKDSLKFIVKLYAIVS
ncbi:MAG: CBS domain-containing protein [bacterium]|nr:CBS domain-containing protein [bacterium]